jgi:hypothetical protein
LSIAYAPGTAWAYGRKIAVRRELEERSAAEEKFRRVLENMADIGGRYSALSYFGLLPACLLGVDVRQVLSKAAEMAKACSVSAPLASNPGVALGAVLGELGRRGRDKVTLLLPPELSIFGDWLEQLLAESTGKLGRGLLPVNAEPLGRVGSYGQDRVFIWIDRRDNPERGLARKARALSLHGHPLVSLAIEQPMDLAGEFMRWEVATATAGAILRINPFDQPNVQESKANTDRLLQRVSSGRGLAEARPALVEGELSFFWGTPARHSTALLRRFLAPLARGGYFSIQAYVRERPEVERELLRIRRLVRDAFRVATTHGYGPRFLHSTGQYHKGGPNTGVFLELTADDAEDLPIPGRSYSFAQLKRAQALGDLSALRRHRRRVLRVHLGPGATRGLARLRRILQASLQGREK